METTAARENFHSTSGGGLNDLWGSLAELRRTVGVLQGGIMAGSPVAGEEGHFTVLRYDDCAAVLRDDTTFTSDIYVDLMGPVMGRTILEMKEPEHKRIRGLAGHAFRHKTLQRWEEELVGPLVDELLDHFAPRGHAELVAELTYPFPVQVIARILGLPQDDYEYFQSLAFTLTSVGDGYDKAVAASTELAEYLRPIVVERRATPADDLISELAAAEIDGEQLSVDEIVSYLRLLLPAGSETTYCSLGSLLFALLTSPAQLAEVRDDRSLVGRAIEELLRWEPAVPFIPRTVVRDVTIAGVDIPAGSQLTVALGSANRDETRFEDPDRYDIHRREQQHLAFASGPHMCLGMHLARMEMRLALEALLDRFPDIELDPGPEGTPTHRPRMQGIGFRAPNCLPVRFTPVV